MTNYRTLRAGFILAASDVFALSRFYEEVFGFELAQRFDDPPYVILTKAGMRLSLTEDGAKGDDFPEFTFRSLEDANLRPSCMVLEVDDCEIAMAELTAHGATIRSEMYRPPWGGARFFCEDPEHNLIEIEELA